MNEYEKLYHHVMNRRNRFSQKFHTHVVYVGRKEWTLICDNHTDFGDERIPKSKCRLDGCEVMMVNEDSHFAIGIVLDPKSMF
ncbi:hypothetical protein [Exiguobacterium antarcticum]|uniref:hypothetical protein n=1 Tax=Exiguobacterium antarcticum TaxID=132920 RepID=UPI0012371781|nr:hypothetical protein [Exiguobacterium antarcticum]